MEAVPGTGGLLARHSPTYADVANVAANNGFIEVSLRDGVSDYSFVPKQLVSAGYRLTLLKEEEVNLETAFMRLTKGMVQ